MNIKDYLSDIILTDGAMGTYFDEIESENYLCSEEANFTNPQLIRRIHKEYIRSGANLIRSNTFSANRETLKKLKRKDSETFSKVTLREFIAKGYGILKEVVNEEVSKGHKAFLAADVGPIYEDSEREYEDVLKEYLEICDIFLDLGADLFVFETFPDTRYVLKMAQYIKRKKKDVFIVGQFAFIPSGYSRTGAYYKKELTDAASSGVLDCVGLNCGIGAAHMSRFYEEFFKEYGSEHDCVFSALPNCGYPQIVRGRAVYSDSVSYFLHKMEDILDLGVKIVGGCCGTTPEYIEALHEELTSKRDRPIRIYAKRDRKEQGTGKDPKKEERKIHNSFKEKLLRGEKVYAVELDPPFDVSFENLLHGAKELKGTPADIITLADSPLARARASSFLTAAKIKEKTGIDVMPHLSCRDQNRIGIRSAFLGAYLHDIRNYLLVTGDPVGRQEKEFTKSVFDFNSIKLMDYVKGMNADVFCGDPVFYGGALNQNNGKVEVIAERMKKKMAAGCQYFLTQPVYSAEGLERLERLKELTGARILIGIMPLVSRRNALFIKNEMPGIHVPDAIVEQYREGALREEWEEVAIRISGKIMEEGKEIGSGYYMMTPFNRVSLIRKILL